MARYGMLDRLDTHGKDQRIVSVDVPYGQAIGFGKKIEEGCGVDEILAATETDWEVGLDAVQTASGIALPKTFAVVRKDTGQPFGNGRTVGDGYTAYQNRELAEFAETLVGAADGSLRFEAGGFLGSGEIVWYQARIPNSIEVRQTELGSDGVDPFLFLLTSHNGTMSTTAFFTARRLFCNNQISSTLAGARNKVTVRHTRKMHERMVEAKKVLRGALGFFEHHVEEMRELDRVAMSAKEMRDFAEKLIGETQESLAEADRTITKAVAARRQAQVDRLGDLFATGLGNVGRSRFDALQAVAEFEDHHREVAGDASRIRRLVLDTGDGSLKRRALKLLRG